MGSSSWSPDFYATRSADRAAKGTDGFDHDKAVRSGKVATAAHSALDPKGVKFRESRDSDAHPESKSIIVWFDVTGSMRTIPVQLQKKLGGLMALLIAKGYIAHPQIMFGAIGDATTDRVPLQVGQFESGIEMDDDLTKLYLEGGGGGHITESYELAAYFAARHTSIDCYEKRGQKGYCIFIGDEMPYPKVKKREVLNVIGADIGEDIPLETIFNELKQKYEVFCFIPTGASNGANEETRMAWIDLLGQNVIRLEDPNTVCEAIALSIGLCEGTIDIDDGATHLKEMGVTGASADAVTRALAPVAARGVSKAVAVASGLAEASGSTATAERL